MEHKHTNQQLRPGQRVELKSTGQRGRVDAVHGQDIYVDLGRGNRAWFAIAQLRPIESEVGAAS